MRSGGEITTSGVLSNGALKPHFIATCGDYDPNAYADSLRGFGEFLDLPHHQRMAQIAAQGSPTSELTSLYRRFLREGGNCPATDFERDIQVRANNIMAAPNPEQRYELWGSFANRYHGLTSNLLNESVTNSTEGQHNILMSARRLEIMSEQSQKVSQTVRHYNNTASDKFVTGDFLILAQNLHIQAMNEGMAELIKILTSIDTMDMSKEVVNGEDLIAGALEKLISTWHEFNNPFYFLDTLRFLLEMNPRNVTISFGFLNDFPKSLDPANPLELRNILEAFLLAASRAGTHKDPAALEFLWDPETSEIQVTLKNTWNYSPQALDEISQAINNYTSPWSWHSQQTSFNERTYFIPVKLNNRKTEDSGQNGSSSSPPPSSTGVPGNSSTVEIAARPSTTAISGFYDPASEEVVGTIDGFFEYKMNPGVSLPCIIDATIIGGTSVYPILPKVAPPPIFLPFPVFTSVPL